MAKTAPQANTKRFNLRPYLITLLLVMAVISIHRWSDFPTFHSQVSQEPGWEQFQKRYSVDDFGEDGYFVRAVKNGYNLFFHTERYGWRFTRKASTDSVHSCAGCHTPEELAYSFVSTDRYDPKLGQRISFEQHVMRCYADPSKMNGFVPTIYDPAIRDLRIFARMVAQSLELSEGYRADAPADGNAIVNAP
ncbi:MAG: hypothetical protein V7707_20205 [Motiliproteus sp.]